MTEMTDERFLLVIKQQVDMTLEKASILFLNRPVIVRTAEHPSYHTVIEQVSLHDQFGLIFLVADLNKWYAFEALEFKPLPPQPVLA